MFPLMLLIPFGAIAISSSASNKRDNGQVVVGAPFRKRVHSPDCDCPECAGKARANKMRKRNSIRFARRG